MAIPMILLLAMPLVFVVFFIDEYMDNLFDDCPLAFYFFIPCLVVLPFYLGLLANVLLIPTMIIASPFGIVYLLF
jgi:hypothetical protein